MSEEGDSDEIDGSENFEEDEPGEEYPSEVLEEDSTSVSPT